jgi:uncharacterized protein (DUF488 family)
MTKDNICIHCQQTFKPIRKDAIFCSDKCRQAAYRTRTEEKEASTLFTIGYQGIKLPDFIKTLKANRIKHLLDVRYSTLSNYKSEFNEYVLAYALENEGIIYHSNKLLGDPKEIKDPYLKKEITDQVFEMKYRKHIADIDMKELAREIKQSGRTALMCFEKYAVATGKQETNCHRSIVATMLVETGEFNEVCHL